MNVHWLDAGGRSGHNPLLAEIVRAMPRLTRSERKVAECLLQDPPAFARSTTSVIAERTQTSAPSIIRFCRSMGYSGLTELKQALVAHLSRHEAPRLFLPAEVPADDDATSLLNEAAASLAQLRPVLAGAATEHAIRLLAQAPQIACVAEYPLGLAALHARDSLLRHGLPASIPAPGHWPLTTPDGLTSRASGLFFCQRMPDAVMLDALAQCEQHGNGAVIISEIALASFVPASARLVLGPPCGQDPLLPYLLMNSLLIAGLLAARARACP